MPEFFRHKVVGSSHVLPTTSNTTCLFCDGAMVNGVMPVMSLITVIMELDNQREDV